MNFLHKGIRQAVIWRYAAAIVGMIVIVFAKRQMVYAKEEMQVDENQILQELVEELNLGTLDEYTKEELPEKLTFQSLVSSMMEDGGEGISAGLLVDYLVDLFFYEVNSARPMFMQILCISLLFALFSKVLITQQGYVNHLSFLAVYLAIMMLLLNSFLLVHEVVEAGLEKMISFMTAFIPTYATTLLLAGNGSSAGIFYEIAFALIYLLELAMKLVFIPGVHIFVLLEMMDHLFEETKLSRLAELIESGIKVALKLALAAVIGLGVVQSLLAPAKDRLQTSSVFQTLRAIPGVGNTFGATGELLVGCGIVIKNSVGMAALVILLVLCASPTLSVACFHVMYRLVAALLQPFADKRIGECVQGVARGCGLYLKIIVDAMLLFFITISMISASTSFIY